MIRRLGFALAVLAGTIYWANCDFVPGVASDPSPPPARSVNTFFEGCFQGQVTDPAGFGGLTIVLEPNPADALLLTGCQKADSITGMGANGTFMGTVTDDRQQARVTVTASTTFTILVRRSPDGDVDATTVTLSNEAAGAPFNRAPDLARCDPHRTCAELGFPMAFVPGGGLP